ncbi:hypothetical protein [Marinospirillum insulare]|uniref:Uncharacterized protein n=1 Tax=Marinospirillum insulare TaxID=217169 RepID=A0ABQ5ZV01_9GAMM|nr:hypothetical protein [Marinospirillum insulare]GLR63829.1 hypothetical protein GCM10007878_12650 [Marinospirillum insulare]
MFSSLTFQKRLLASVILSGSVFLFLALLYTYDYRSKLTEKIMQEQSDVLQVVLRERIKAKENFGLGLAVMLANNPLIGDYLVNDQRTKALNYVNSVTKNYAETTNYRGLKIQIHTADGHSWLRNWTLKSTVIIYYFALVSSK